MGFGFVGLVGLAVGLLDCVVVLLVGIVRVGCFDLMRSAEFMLVGLVGSSGLLVFCLLFWVCVGLFVGCF